MVCAVALRCKWRARSWSEPQFHVQLRNASGVPALRELLHSHGTKTAILLRSRLSGCAPAQEPAQLPSTQEAAGAAIIHNGVMWSHRRRFFVCCDPETVETEKTIVVYKSYKIGQNSVVGNCPPQTDASARHNLQLRIDSHRYNLYSYLCRILHKLKPPRDLHHLKHRTTS